MDDTSDSRAGGSGNPMFLTIAQQLPSELQWRWGQRLRSRGSRWGKCVASCKYSTRRHFWEMTG
eukprot:1232673-Rhodomonas_salina.2